MRGDPPEGEEHVHFRLQRGYLKDFLGEVLPVLEEEGLGVFVSSSGDDIASEVADDDIGFVCQACDTHFVNKGFANKCG